MIGNETIVFIGYDAIGDHLTNSGMVRYLLEKYKTIYVVTNRCLPLVKNLFKDDNRIIPIISEHLIDMMDPNFDIIDVRVWEKYPPNPFNPKVIEHNGIYYDSSNKIGNIAEEWVNDNASSFYYFMGLPSDIRLKKFFFQRSHEEENELFTKLDLQEKEYVVICEFENCLINKNHINPNDKIVNVHNISHFFDIIKVVEKAKEVHFVENSISLFTYYLQMSNLMDKVNINIHSYCRKEPYRLVEKELHMKKLQNRMSNFIFNMMMYPKLDNWNIVWE